MLPISSEGKPFLSLLLERLVDEGVDEVCVVVVGGSRHPVKAVDMDSEGLSVGYARQTVLRADKPMGTADAVQRGLEARPEWRWTVGGHFQR